MMMVVVALGIALLVFALTSWLGPKNMTAEKAIPYESGAETPGAGQLRISVKFYLTAILFVVFDVEAVFLYPWAIHFRALGLQGLLLMLGFLSMLSLVLVYAWRKGALEWQR